MSPWEGWIGLLRVQEAQVREGAEPVLATETAICGLLQPWGALAWFWTLVLLKDDHAAPRGFKGGPGSVELSSRPHRALGLALGLGFLVARCPPSKVLLEILPGSGHLQAGANLSACSSGPR